MSPQAPAATHAANGQRPKLSEAIRHADDRGVALSDRYLARLVRGTGWQETLRYIDKLAEIMDTAAALGIDCRQSFASRRLALADGDVQRVVDGLRVEARRRADRRRAGCGVIVPPSGWRERSNAYANCGCPRCYDRLAIHMQPYIRRLVRSRMCDGLEPDEVLVIARAKVRALPSLRRRTTTGRVRGHYAVVAAGLSTPALTQQPARPPTAPGTVYLVSMTRAATSFVEYCRVRHGYS